MNDVNAERIVNGIIADLSDRRGLKQEWYQIDEDVQVEIKECWKEIVLAEANRMNHAHITYDGQPLVLLRFDSGEGALAFPHQVRKDGYIKLECQLEPGYAHIDHDGQIWRKQCVIAYIDDDEELARAWDSLNTL